MSDQTVWRAVTYEVTDDDGTPGVDLVAWNPDTDKETWSWHPARHRCSRCRGAHQPWDLIAADAHLVCLGWKRVEPWSRTRPGVWECAVREREETK